MTDKYKIEGRNGEATITDCLLVKNYLSALKRTNAGKDGFQRCSNARKYLERAIGLKFWSIEN